MRYLLDGRRKTECFATEAAMTKWVAEFNAQHGLGGVMTFDGAITEYCQKYGSKHWRQDGTAGRTTDGVLRRFFQPFLAKVVTTKIDAVARFDEITGSAGTKNAIRKRLHTFDRWLVKQRLRRVWMTRDEDGDAIIERVPGEMTGADKPTLTGIEAMRYRPCCIRAAMAGDEDAVLALAELDLGLRPSEYMECVGRDVDGQTLHYTDAKSRKRCEVEVPEPLAGFLANLAAQRRPDEPLFRTDQSWFHAEGGRSGVGGRREYPCAVARRFCAKAGVTLITAQQMRATHDKLAALDLAKVAGDRHTVEVAEKHYIGRQVVKQAKVALLAAKLGGETCESLPTLDAAPATMQDEKASVVQ